MLKEDPLLAPIRIGTDGAKTFPAVLKAVEDEGLLRQNSTHHVTKILQQGIESDHFRVKQNMPKVGCFQSFTTARRTTKGFEAMLWLRKGFDLACDWTVREQNHLLATCFGLESVNKT
jgi:transposase-like protein